VSTKFGIGYCIRTLTRNSWNHYTDCWIVSIVYTCSTYFAMRWSM